MKILHKILTILLLSTITLFAAGCWDYLDIEKWAFITSIGIDYVSTPHGPTYRVTAEMPHPLSEQTDGGNGSSQPKVVVSNSDDSIADAIINLQDTLERRPLWEQIL